MSRFIQDPGSGLLIPARFHSAPRRRGAPPSWKRQGGFITMPGPGWWAGRASPSTYRGIVASDSPDNWWHLDDAYTGNHSVVVDSVGGANGGTNGNAATNITPGILVGETNGCLRNSPPGSSSSSDCVQLSSTPQVNLISPAQSFTLEWWQQAPTVLSGLNAGIMQLSSTSSGNNPFLITALNIGGFAPFLAGFPTLGVGFNVPFDTNAHYFMLTYDGSFTAAGFNLYRDNAAVSQVAPGGNPAANNNFSYFANYFGASQTYAGLRMQEIALYKGRILTSGQRTNHYNAGI